jgi:hypothetical protein
MTISNVLNRKYETGRIKLWDVMLCSLLNRYRFGRGNHCLHLPYPEDGGSRLLLNVVACLPNYVVPHPTRL